MPARVQQLVLGLGKGKQTNISTAAASFLRFKKLDTDAHDAEAGVRKRRGGNRQGPRVHQRRRSRRITTWRTAWRSTPARSS